MKPLSAVFLTLGCAGATTALRFAFGLDPLIASVAANIFAQAPWMAPPCLFLHNLAESSMVWAGASTCVFERLNRVFIWGDSGSLGAVVVFVAMIFFLPGMTLVAFAKAEGTWTLLCASLNLAVSVAYLAFDFEEEGNPPQRPRVAAA